MSSSTKLPKPSNPPAKKQTRRILVLKPQTWRLHYQGYILDRGWTDKQICAKLGLPDNSTADINQFFRFVHGFVRDAGFSGAPVKNVAVGKGNTALCIVLASNESEKAMKLPPQDRIDKLKKMLGTDEPPKWYRYSG